MIRGCLFSSGVDRIEPVEPRMGARIEMPSTAACRWLFGLLRASQLRIGSSRASSYLSRFAIARCGEVNRRAGCHHGNDPREITRPHKRRASPDVLRFGRLEIDRGAREARIDGAPCPLTGYQFALLLTLAEHAGRVMSRDITIRGTGYVFAKAQD